MKEDEDEFFEEDEDKFFEDEEDEEDEFESLVEENELDGFTFVGNIPVDSGQIAIIDPCYIKGDFANEYDEKPYGVNYSGACKASLSDEGFGIFGKLGFCTRTAFGDGLYPVFVKRAKDGTILEAKIVFSASS